MKMRPPKKVPVARITVSARYSAFIRVVTFQRPSAVCSNPVTSACFICRCSCNSSLCFIISEYFRRSICARRE